MREKTDSWCFCMFGDDDLMIVVNQVTTEATDTAATPSPQRGECLSSLTPAHRTLVPELQNQNPHKTT